MLTPFRGTTETEGFNLAKQHGDTEMVDEMTDSQSTLAINEGSKRQRSRNNNGHIRVEETQLEPEKND